MIKSLLFWIGFPFAIPQALKVKKQAVRLEDAKGGSQGAIGTGRPLKLLGIGDSIIAGVGTSHVSKSWLGQTCHYLSQQLQAQIQWHRIAQSGANLAYINQNLLVDIKKDKYDIIIISAGVNDVTGLTKIWKWRRQLYHLLSRLKTKSPEAVIIVSGVPPMHVFPLLPQPLRFLLGIRAKSLDKVIQQQVKSFTKVIHLPIEIELDSKNFSVDGYHPSEFGCQKWGEITAAMIIEELN